MRGPSFHACEWFACVYTLGESKACLKGLRKIDCRFKTFPECLNVYLKKTIPVSNSAK